MWLCYSWPRLHRRIATCWRKGHDWRPHEYWIRCEYCWAFKKHSAEYWAEYEAERAQLLIDDPD